MKWSSDVEMEQWFRDGAEVLVLSLVEMDLRSLGEEEKLRWR